MLRYVFFSISHKFKVKNDCLNIRLYASRSRIPLIANIIMQKSAKLKIFLQRGNYLIEVLISNFNDYS